MTPIPDIVLAWPRFAYPLVLGALGIPIVLIIWTWSRRWLVPGRRLVLPVDRAIGSSGWIWWTLIAFAEMIPSLVLACGILILAGPFRNGPPKEKRDLTNIEFCLDISGSMMAPYGEGNRYDAATAAIDKFLDFRKGDAFGLTFFGDAFVHWVPLTTDPSAIRCSFPFMAPDIAPAPFGGTAIAKSLQGCKKQLDSRADGEKMILLVTDGISYDLVGADAEIAKQMNDSKITVFCVIAAEFDPQPEIVNICRLTGGEAFRADDPDALKTVFKKIDLLKPAKFTPTITETVDYYEPFALVGVGLTLIGLLTAFGLRYTPW